MTVDVR